MKNLAKPKLSGKPFKDVLKDELVRITESIGECEHTTGSKISQGPSPVSTLNETVEIPSSAHESLYCARTVQEPEFSSERSSSLNGPPHTEPRVLPSSSEKTFQLSPDKLSTPEVQRVVVEHIVKSTEIATNFQSTVRLKPFSGILPWPKYEVDYDTWCNSLEFYMTDPSLSDVMLVRRIVDSLIPPAADVVKPLGPRATAEDGDELFVKFLNTNQNPGEKPSSYLQRLQLALNTILEKKAISDSDANKHLIKQFCRGCWNNNIISTL